MQKIDYLLIGQGLAGTLLAHFLLQKGKSIQVIDQNHQGAASKIAAGVINPVTGRRYVKSWLIDELLPFAKTTYQNLEQELEISIYHEKNIIRTLFNHREENDWVMRRLSADYQKYILPKADLAAYQDATEAAYSYGEIQYAAQVDVGKLVEEYQKLLITKELLRLEAFDYQKISFTDSKDEKEHSLSYGDNLYQKIIFCEGHRGAENPYFKNLAFNLAKGEILIIKIVNIELKKMFKHRIFLIPLGEDLYWVGATYDWKYADDEPTEAGKNFLLNRLQEVLTVPFEVVQHQAAIRPTIKDRRPLLGLHPKFSSLGIFNGLGTKGASLGPYFAKAMSDFLVEKEEVPAEVEISRFS